MGQLARGEHVFRYPSANPRVTARFELARTVNRSLRVVKLLAGLPMPRSTRDTDSPHDPGWDASMGDLGAGEVPAGQVGRLAIKGPTGCKYLDDPRQSQYVQNGWNLTGDAYLLDEDGHYVYQARTDDMIISGGYNIAGPEVESALMLHPAVAECGVVGVPDEDRGQIVKAFVVLRPGQVANDLMARALQDFVKQTIAPYKYPRAVEFRDSLPRTETGKLQRFKLRQAA